MSDVTAQSSYYAVIPGWLLSDRRLSDGAKLFYGEVSRRCNEKGYCWASNSTLAHDLQCCERTVTRWVRELEECGAILTENVGVSDRKRRHERRIRMSDAHHFDIDKNVNANVDKNGDVNIDKNVYHHNENNKSKNNNPPISPQGEACVDFFDRFWALYPRKQGKQAARKAWDKLAPDAALCRRMSAALKAQMRSAEWTRDGGRYIPYPSTWLNGRRWEDEVLPAPIAPQRSSPAREEDEWL